MSILAEPPVAVVDKVVDEQGKRKRGRGLPEIPLFARGPDHRGEELFSSAGPEGDAGRVGCKPVKLFTVDEVFGGWQKAQKEHFDDGGVFDQIGER